MTHGNASNPGADASSSDNARADADADAAPTVGYWHLWSDADGVSHQTPCRLTSFMQKSMGGAASQWNDSLGRGDRTILFAVLPVGWVGDWHENPAPQWIVPLSGRWWVEAMDGTRVEMGAGEVSFGGDQHCTRDSAGRVGHRSGTVGDEPARLMIVQMHGPTAHAACPFR